MRIKSFHVSLYIIVPLIFSSLSLLSMVVAYRLITYAWKTGLDELVLLTIWGAIITGGTYCFALIISIIILRPMEKFVERAKEIPAVQSQFDNEKKRSGDQLSHFTSVFHHITDFLSKVDARQLFPEIIGQSEVIRGVLSQITKVAPTEASVLITGASGTGKEVVANAIHKHSHRRDKSFVAVNCAAIPDGLLESELFGHEKGAFTGATAQKIGRFEQAHEGTLFLDEIGDMPLETQAKILRALETGICERVGGTRSIHFDVRVIAATNKNFAEMIEAGQFREDLFHRLNVFPVHLPALRERKDDIHMLASYFLDKLGKQQEITAEASHLLVSYAWPGNIRELKNTIERASVLAGDGPIVPKNLPELVYSPVEEEDGIEVLDNLPLDECLASYEKRIIVNTLTRCNGVQVRAAEMLGIKQRSLWHRIKKYEIDISAIKK